MVLLSCHIIRFGCLCQKEYTFTPGLNVLCQENGTGKTTLAAFIKAMFYGLPSSRAASLDENERKRYTPWEGGQFGGSLCFSAGGRGYRIERLFGAKEKDDRLTVYRLDTGMPYGDFGTSPGEALFGVNAEGFAKSLFISRISGEDDLNEPSIRAGLGAFADTAADLGDFDEAEKKLTGEIKALQTTGERGELPELSRKIAEKEKEIARRLAVLKEAEEKRARLADLAKEKEELLRQLQNATERSKLIAKESAYREHFAVAKSMEKVYLRQKEEGRTLSSAFVRGGVTEEEMSAAEEKTEVYLQAAAAFRGEEDRKPDERTRTLKEKYQTAENAARLAASFGKDCRAWRDAESQKAVLTAALPEEKKWDRTPPTREQIEKAKRYAQSPASGRKSPLPAVLALCGGLCVLAGALLYFFLPPALPGAEYVAWGCGAALLLCGVLLLGKGGKTAEEKEIVSLLSCFGYAKKPYASSAMRFVMDGEAYLKAREEREALQKRLDGVREEAESLRQSLSAVSQKYGLPDDPDAGEKELSLQAAFLAEAEREEKEIGEKLVLLREKLDCCREDAKAFLSTLFICGPEDSPDEVLRMMKDRRIAARNAAEKEAEAEKEWKRYLAAYRIDPGKEPVYTAEEELSVRQEEQNAQTRMYRNMQEEGALKAETEALEDEAGLLSENQEEKNALLQKKEELTQKLAWLTGARTYLVQAKENLSSRYLTALKEKLSRYLALSEGEDKPFSLDTSLRLWGEKDGIRRPLEAFSAGERDLAEFCARLAVSDAVFTAEPPFYLLDDPFVHLDNRRYAAMMRLLKNLSAERQILYFVCRKELSGVDFGTTE